VLVPAFLGSGNVPFDRCHYNDRRQTFDGVHHGFARAVRDGLAEARLLAFELKPKPALSRRNQMKAEVGA
jgi:hypothetical protein